MSLPKGSLFVHHQESGIFMDLELPSQVFTEVFLYPLSLVFQVDAIRVIGPAPVKGRRCGHLPVYTVDPVMPSVCLALGILLFLKVFPGLEISYAKFTAMYRESPVFS